MYPRLIIDKEKYRENIRAMKTLCASHNLSLMGVTKVYCAASELVGVLEEEEIDFLADSRIGNLRSMRTKRPKVLLRIASRHEVDEVVRHADISLNSDLGTIRLLDAAARRMEKRHGIILMVDIGDLREGVYYREDIVSMAEEIAGLTAIDFAGLGTNLTCYGGVIPEPETLERLTKIVEDIERALGRELDIISGGNSSHVPLLQEDVKVEKINNLRIGEAMVLGRETAYGRKIPDFHDDVFTLEADIVEIGEKPSVPEGRIGMDAFGKKPRCKDVGTMTRAILAIGRQDADHGELRPSDKDIELIGSSSDHIIADLTKTKATYKTGDVLRFKLTYGSVLSLMTSPYVVKDYV